MRKILVALLLTIGSALPAAAQLHVSIGINLPAYPTLQRIPNYPVYYAPRLSANYFFYDGLYWVFDGDDWLASSWYNGPWAVVDRYEVPVALLHVPVRYYRSRPSSFRSYRVDSAPHWHEYWGPTWAQRRDDWQRWDVRRAPAPAPLPVYQRRYTRDRYPVLEQQYVIQSRNYRYEPRENVAREVYRERRVRADARDSLPRGHQRSEHRGPPDHAPAHGYRQREARWNDRDRAKEMKERAKEQREAERERMKDQREALREREKDQRAAARERAKEARERARARGDDRRGPPDHAQGKGKGHDEGRGRGRDKD